MKRRFILATALALLALLPLAGQSLRGFPEGFFSFPPLVHGLPAHAPFSWPIFAVFAAIGLFAAGVFLFPRRFGFDPPPPAPAMPASRFPLHGKIGLALLLVSWILAWGRFDLPPVVRQHTFFPLWLGFIFCLDGLAFRRAGRSLFANRRRTFFLPFPVSALSWWYFEFLNRFVRNWWYPDRMDFGPVHYLIYSSLCFSTVIPAIFEIRALLDSFPSLRGRWSRGPRLRIPRAAAVFAALGAGLLPLVPLFPDPLFFATWIAPLALLAGALGLARVKSPFDPIRDGDWSAAIALALAALICGFFWETWNFGSSLRWAYAVPYVDRYRLFAMPVVGYAGYLPFGPVCACFWLAWTGLLCRQESGDGVQGSAGSDLPSLNPEP